MRNLRTPLGLVVLASVLSAGGCGRAISEGVSMYTGPKHVVSVLSSVPGSLGQYTSFEVATFSDDSAGQVPRELISQLPSYVKHYLAEKGIPDTGGKTLLIRGTIIYYENSDKILDQAFGPFEEVIARVELVDKASGKVLGVANCVGRSDTSYNKGTTRKIEGLGKAIASWVDKNYPKGMKTK